MKLLGTVLGFETADVDPEGKMETESAPKKTEAPTTAKPSEQKKTAAAAAAAEQSPVSASSRFSSSKINLWFSSQAEAEKEKGNEAYKKKDFETALAHYNKATELDPVNMTYYTNRAGKVDLGSPLQPSFRRFQRFISNKNVGTSV